MYEKSYFLKVSVILTVYNGEKYIYECMESVIHQTLDEIEIICIDDSSSDNTLNILGKLQNEDDRIKVISNQFNLGAGASRNKGLEIAKGEYIIFLDADDIFEKDMLEKAYSKAKRCEADICIFKEDLFCEKIKDDLKIENLYISVENQFDLLYKNNKLNENINTKRLAVLLLAVGIIIGVINLINMV